MASLSKRAQNAPSSPVRKLVPLMQKTKSSGVNVLEVNIGQPDFPTPKLYFDSLKEYEQKTISYEPASGNKNLIVAWANFYGRIQNISLNSDNFLITAGGSEGLIFTISAITDPGDEILVIDPTYANYIGLALMLGVKLVGIPTTLQANFSPQSVSEIEPYITPKTKGILFCNPGNPTGAILSQNFIEELISWTEKKGLWIVSDECYRELIYNAPPLETLAKRNKDNIVVIDSISKRASLCGARIGCIYTSNKSLLEKIAAFASQRLSVSSAEQFACSKVLDSLSLDTFKFLSNEYFKRAISFKSGLEAYPEISVLSPQGAFFTLIELNSHNAEKFAEFLLAEFQQDRETVCITPAIGFYLNPKLGINQARVAFVLEDAKMKRVGKIIGEGYKSFVSK